MFFISREIKLIMKAQLEQIRNINIKQIDFEIDKFEKYATEINLYGVDLKEFCKLMLDACTSGNNTISSMFDWIYPTIRFYDIDRNQLDVLRDVNCFISSVFLGTSQYRIEWRSICNLTPNEYKSLSNNDKIKFAPDYRSKEFYYELGREECLYTTPYIKNVGQSDDPIKSYNPHDPKEIIRAYNVYLEKIKIQQELENNL